MGNLAYVGEHILSEYWIGDKPPNLKTAFFWQTEVILSDFSASPFFREPEKLRNSLKTPAEIILNRSVLPRISGFHTGEVKLR
jgi:hypothetical protein